MANYIYDSVPAGTVGSPTTINQEKLTGSNTAAGGLAVGRNAGATTFGTLSTTNTVFMGVAVKALASEGYDVDDDDRNRVNFVIDGQIVAEFATGQTIEPGTIVSWQTSDGKAIAATTGSGRGKVIEKYTDTTALVLVQ